MSFKTKKYDCFYVGQIHGFYGIEKLRQQETTARAAPTIKPSPATDLSEKEAEFDALIGRLKRAPVAEDIIRKLNRRFGT